MDKLRFTPYAWAKLLYIRDLGDTEVSFFGLSHKDDLGLVIDVLMVPQECTYAYTEFKEEAITKFFEEMVDLGWHPEEFGRIWCHTHPGNSAKPSQTDEDTLVREF